VAHRAPLTRLTRAPLTTQLQSQTVRRRQSSHGQGSGGRGWRTSFFSNSAFLFDFVPYFVPYFSARMMMPLAPTKDARPERSAQSA
jgi:hypothetical protein